jgi:hypothetical protein
MLSSLPFLLTNETGESVQFALYGLDNSTGQWAYFQRDSGTGSGFSGRMAPVQELGAGRALPSYGFSGTTATLTLPDTPSGLSSATIVMTVGTIGPSITVASNFSVPRPAPSNPTLVSASTNPYYDFVEFTYDAGDNLYINTTQVDQFGFPITLTAAPTPAHGAPVGVTPGISRDAVFQAFSTFLSQSADPSAKDFQPLLQTSTTGSPYRIIAPGQYLAIPGNATDPLASYFDSAIQSFYSAPPPLTLIASGSTFVGTATTHNPVASGDIINGVRHTNPADNRSFKVIDFVGQNGPFVGKHFYVYSPVAPPSWVSVPSVGEQVFANNGVFADNAVRASGIESDILGNLENQVVSALTRGIANVPRPSQYATTTAFWSDPAQAFPAGQKASLYAKFLHTGKVGSSDIFIGGRVYAFPYSDQGDQASYFTVSHPTSVSVTLGAWGGTPVAPPASGVTFAVIGDYGTGSSDEGRVANLVKSWQPDFIITTGDNNYGSGAASTIDTNIGQFYHEYIGAYTGSYGAGSPTNRFFPSLGNHDWGTAGAQPYLDYFTLPGNERYYNFTKGPVEFFVVDSDSNEPDGISPTSLQGQWLQAAMARSTASWQVVYFHHAAYSSGGHGSETDLQWPFEQWGADAVLSGHDHTYERLQIGNVPYFVNGLGGGSMYAFGTPVAGSQVRFNGDSGAMLVTGDSEHLTFQFITQAGQLIDSHTITHSTTPPTPPPITPPTVPPSLTVSATSLSLGTTTAGTPGTSQSFSVGGEELTASLVVTAPANVQLSRDGTIWSGTLSLAPGATGAVAATTIRTRLAASAPVGTVLGGIAVTSTGATSKQVAVSGTVTTGATASLSRVLFLLPSGGLSNTPDATVQSASIPSAEGKNFDGRPTNAVTFAMHGLTGTYIPTEATHFALFVDAGTRVGNGTQARVSYDFGGDGIYDRVETFRYFAEDNRIGWQGYKPAVGLKSASGAFADFRSGSVKVDIWNAIGKAPVSLRMGGSPTVGQKSRLRLPFSDLKSIAVPAAPPTTPLPPGTVPSVPTTAIGNTLYVLASGALGSTPGTSAQVTTIASANGNNFDGTPTNAITSTIRGLTGAYDPTQQTQFSLFLDAGTQAANGTQVRISYDFNGDGVFDRVETSRYFATDNRLGWEAYTQAAGLKSSTGTFANFQSGRVKVDIWNAIGKSTVGLRTGASVAQGQQSSIRLPFQNLKGA